MSDLLHIPADVREIADLAARRYYTSAFEGPLADLITETLAADRAQRFMPKKRMGLTSVQADTLRYIRAYSVEHGFPPSFGEIAKALDLKSKSGVHRIVTALEERGHIRRLPYRARAIEIIGAP